MKNSTIESNAASFSNKIAIDKAKGIIAKPMPREWHDRHSVNLIEDTDTRRFYLKLVADKKPYFMRLIYPALMKQYNTYIKTQIKMRCVNSR